MQTGLVSSEELHLALRFGVSGAELWRGRAPGRPFPAERGLSASPSGCEAAGARPELVPGRAVSRAFRDSSALITGVAEVASIPLPTVLDTPEAAS